MAKHMPLRMCIACRQMFDQETMIRFVCNDKITELDTPKKKFGRGAYICKDEKCLKAAEKKNLLARHFRCTVNKEIYTKAGELIDR